MAPNNQESAGSQEDAEWSAAGCWMGFREDAGCLGGSRVAWRAPSRKEIAEQLGGQQAARGRRVSRRAPGAKRTPEGPGEGGVKQSVGCRVIRRTPNAE